MFYKAAIISVFSVFFTLHAGNLVLLNHGKTDYVIIAEPSPSAVDAFALKELSWHLKQMTGLEFPVRRSSGEHPKRIFLGWTDSARKILGKNSKWETLKEQDAVIQTNGDDLFLYGKGKHGNLYAVYEFLENRLGCRYLTAHGDIFIPPKDRIVLPDETSVVSYAFAKRSLMQWFYADKRTARLFAYRNRQNLLIEGNEPGIENLVNMDGPNCHTISLFLPGCKAGAYSPEKWLKIKPDGIKDYFKLHPEWFSMNEKGVRVNDRQYCFSNRELRRELVKNALIYHQSLEKNGRKAYLGVDLNDIAYEICCCKECAKLCEKYQSPGGAFYDFLFEFCRARPDLRFATLAYQKPLTQIPPSNIAKCPENLTVIFCPINSYYSGTFDSENRHDLKDLRKWISIANEVWVWYYPNKYNIGDHFAVPVPVGNFERLARDIRSMRDAGVAATYFEHDSGGVKYSINFSKMQTYVMSLLSGKKISIGTH